jgi:hypothetical protein
MRIIKQYHNDVWVGLYKSPYNFTEKDREKQRQENILEEVEPSDDETTMTLTMTAILMKTGLRVVESRDIEYQPNNQTLLMSHLDSIPRINL